jgi:primosomal protein N' (replication factor Y)
MITVDMLDARKAGQVSGTISRLLLNEVIARLHRKEGVILFQNRRGFSSMLECTDCGDVPQCPNCSVSLTYHKSANQLRCHYCGFVTKHINVCKECGGMKLKEIGFGTQRIEDELTEQIREFGLDVKINRVDLDSTSRKGAFRKLLHSFSIGETDVLVGTQMVAKGLDFERVTLVGVVNADLQLFLPDFRASERTFQLITQVSGRAGRSSSKPGEVLIQTSHPDNPAIRFALKGSYKNFYEDEIQQRLEADYPPFSRFVTIELSGKDEKQVYEKSMILAKLLPSRNPALICLGPVPRYIAKVRSQFRQIIVIKNIKRLDPNGKILRTVLKQTMDKFNEGKGASTVNITIDIDSYTGL